MKKTLRLPVIAFMAMPLFANAQITDSTSAESIPDTSAAKMIRCYSTVTETTKQSYLYLTPEYNFSKLLDGLSTGLQTTNPSGQPGASAEMLIRGMTNQSGNNNPLIVLDGIPYYGDFALLDKSDIYAINIAKDASSTFQFANNAANGIIYIQTKSALLGSKNTHKEKLEVNAQFGTSTPEIPAYKTLDTKQYFETLNSAILNSGMNENVVDFAGGYNPYNVPKDMLIGSDGKLNPNATLRYQDNWRDEMNRAGIRQNYNVATSASGKTGAYYLSTSYLNDKGYVHQTDYERFSSRFNAHLNITKWMQLGIRSQAAIGTQHYAVQQLANSNVLQQSQTTAPIYPVYYRNKNGDKEIDPATGNNKYDMGDTFNFPNSSIGERWFLMGNNTIGSLYEDVNSIKTNAFILNPYLSASFLKSFTYTANFNYGYNKDTTSEEYGKCSQLNGSNFNEKNELKQINFRQSLTWNQYFNYHHFQWTANNDYINQEVAFINWLFIPNSIRRYMNIPSKYKSLNYYTQLSYDYKDKYFVSGGFRRDQTKSSSIAYNKWQNNWFVAAAYKISNENFLKNVTWIDDIKLKASYGTQGHFLYVNYSGSMADTGTTITTNKQISGGLEAVLFHDRLSFELNVYNRNSAGTIQYPISPSTGIVFVPGLAKYNNKGIEFNTYSVNIQHSNFKWSSWFRLSHNNNNITELPQGIDSLIIGSRIYKKGISVANFYLPEYAGVDKNTGASLYYAIDASGNKITTESYNLASYTYKKDAGSAFPKVYGSLTNTFEIKQFEFSFQVNYSIGGKYYDEVYRGLMNDAIYVNSWSTDILKAWTPEHTNTNVPKLSVTDLNATLPSTRFLKDASYLSFANAYLGYSFNHEKVKKLKMQSLRIYASANNLFMIAGRRGMNPQADLYNNPGYVYAPARSIVLGLKVGI